MSPPTTTPTLVVFQPGPDTRVAGGSARARSLRVAARVGAAIVEVSALASHGNDHAILVPPDVLIDVALFSMPAPATATQWEAFPGIGVIAGPARELSPYVVSRGGHDEQALGNELKSLPRQQVPADAIRDISSPAARRRTTWHILERTAKPTDGWVSRHWNRPISRRISFAALSLRLAPRHASLVTLLIGLATAVFAVRPGYLTLVVTGILFQLASVLDGVDGEMARATLTESEAGAKLDAVVDQITYVACFVGVTVGWAREGGGVATLYWTAAIAVALVASLLRGARFVARYAPDASFVFIDRSVRRAARDSDTLALRMAAAGFALLRRDLFSAVFLGVSFLGRRAFIPGMVAVGILLANVTLSVYRRELAAAAGAEHAPPLRTRVTSLDRRPG